MGGMNITIDDVSSQFVWAGDDWRAQAPNQLSINSNYFFQTYHAAQNKGANVTITFIASACQLYGSKGPNHGNYSVTFDNAIKYSPGFSETTQYRQLLFSHVFGEEVDTHTIILRNEEDFWLDLDFMVLTINGTAPSTQDFGFFTSTVSPATAVPANPTSTDSTSSTDPSSSSSNSIFRTLTFALAGVLGVVILLLLLWFFIFRKRGQQNGQQRADSASQEFRYGHKIGPSVDVSHNGEGKDANSGKHSSSVLGFGRTKVGKGMEDASLMQTPTSASVTAADHSPFSRNSALGNPGVSGAARETLIALNNMGKRPGYRNLAGGESSTSVVVTSHRDQGRETPTSLRTFGSGGQTWLGASKNEPDVRFRGRAREDSITGSGPSSHGSETSGAHLLSGRAHNRGGSNQTTPRDEDYASGGLGLGIYSSPRNDLDQRRADLRRSASVASSGIIDRMASSPPPAVPELPPLSSTASNLSGRSGLPSNRRFSPNPTDSMYSQPGALRLQPPPIRGQQEERERERAQRERERSEKEKEAAREREESERLQRVQERYSRPPPEYMATPTSAESFVPPVPPVPTQGAILQRNGTRTGDIPIGIEGGFVDDGESQESHSVAHAYVQTALHVSVPPSAPGQVPPLPATQMINQKYSSTSSLPYAQPPPRPQHSRENISGSASASGSQSLNTAYPPSSKRAITPDNSRSYTPDRTMAIPRTSEDRVWTLEGPNATSRGVGVPIMDDRTRLAAGGIGGTPRRVSRIPPPAQ